MKCLPFLLALTASPLFAAALPLTVAVFEFQSPEEGVRDLGAKVSVLVGAKLSADERVITVERTELDKALSEQEFGLSGTVSAENAAKVGQLTGAKVLVTGRVIKAENETLAIAKVIGTETSRVFGTQAKLAPGIALSEATNKLALSIADLVVKNADSLSAKTDSPEERIARIKAALPACARPSVSVKISEQHFGAPVNDPAAQTELAFLLQQTGFKVVDAGSATRADFSIEGEAFSERGLQRGALRSCKARVEIALRRLANGSVVANDRQVSVAVDLGEHIAAKSALENAARVLAGRVLPQIK
jgi:hypothetical protein